MATSTNYGWAEPDNSSLVKNGASDIRTLGNAIDTSVWNVGKGQAGKNKIINGDFNIWQRGTSTTVPIANNSYSGPDRFQFSRNGTGSVVTVSRQAFTPGTAPVATYEGNYFMRFNQTTAGSGGTYNEIITRIEDVTTYAGQTVTFSFWGKADSARTTGALVINQNFGSGGSATVLTTVVAGATGIAFTTGWVRYSYSFTVPSIAGKTIGTSSYFEIDLQTIMNAVYTLDFYGWQLEYGSIATPFQTASGGSPQAELAMCQRYYYRFTSASNYTYFGGGFSASATQAKFIFKLATTMRTSPSFSATSAGNLQINGSAASPSVTSVTLDQANPDSVGLFANCSSGLTAGQGILIIGNNSSAPLFEFSSEL